MDNPFPAEKGSPFLAPYMPAADAPDPAAKPFSAAATGPGEAPAAPGIPAAPQVSPFLERPADAFLPREASPAAAAKPAFPVQPQAAKPFAPLQDFSPASPPAADFVSKPVSPIQDFTPAPPADTRAPRPFPAAPDFIPMPAIPAIQAVPAIPAVPAASKPFPSSPAPVAAPPKPAGPAAKPEKPTAERMTPDFAGAAPQAAAPMPPAPPVSPAPAVTAAPAAPTVRGTSSLPRTAFAMTDADAPAATAFAITTGPSLEGNRIVAYLGVVSVEIVIPKDLLFRNPAPYGELHRIKAAEEQLQRVKRQAFEELGEKARALGAGGIIGACLQFSQFDAVVFLCSAYGTAVKVSG